jgi:hypothetical protein
MSPLGPDSDVSALARHVRCTLRSRRRQAAPACPFGATDTQSSPSKGDHAARYVTSGQRFWASRDDHRRASSSIELASKSFFYLRFESGGQSGRTSIGFPALCTVGAAELASPPVSGSTALFSTAIESAFFSPALPVVTDEVVQFVSGFKFGGDVDCAPAGPAIKATLSTAASIRIAFSLTKPFTVSGKNVPSCR